MKANRFSWVAVGIVFTIAVLAIVLIGILIGRATTSQVSLSVPTTVIFSVTGTLSQNQPFFPLLPGGAAQWGGTEAVSSGFQRTYYRVPGGDVEAVANFYKSEMSRFYGNSQDGSTLESCQRLPPSGEFTNIPDAQRPANDGKIYDPTFVAGQSLPFLYNCLFDRSGLNIAQSTLVSIQPGTPSDDPNYNTEGDVVIIYEQRWQR